MVTNNCRFLFFSLANPRSWLPPMHRFFFYFLHHQLFPSLPASYSLNSWLVQAELHLQQGFPSPHLLSPTRRLDLTDPPLACSHCRHPNRALPHLVACQTSSSHTSAACLAPMHHMMTKPAIKEPWSFQNGVGNLGSGKGRKSNLCSRFSWLFCWERRQKKWVKRE